MKNRARLLLLIGTLLLGGCAAPAATVGPEASASSGPASALPTVAATVRATIPPLPTFASSCTQGAGELIIVVPSRSNIFAAGHSEPTDPGGGGAGILPPVVELPTSQPAAVVVPCADGLVNCCVNTSNSSNAGPAGGRWSTDIPAYDGISGIVHRSLGVFLTGVFLGDDEPADPAPPRLDFSELCPDPGTTCSFTRLEPELGQLFYIGSGGTDREFAVPSGATRLFLGIADAALTTGPHGYYGNNAGSFTAVVAFR